HVATTILGNTGVEQTIDGDSFGEGAGVAPAANLISYKICWEDTDPDTGGCYTSASVAAVEQAIENNVDVLNYSISGSNASIVDPVAMAFKSAAEAGIF
ncbi:S8 family serine peptidase, partial [Micrococcus luteus]|nr:S8 family serine peptidase [Micrococcus luteus]